MRVAWSLGPMSSSAVEMLQTHLTKVKLEHAERESSLVSRLRKAEEESARLRVELDAAGDELELCWAHVDQMRLEQSKKWRIEERDDWRALVQSVQQDRTRLQRENAALRSEVRRLGGDLPVEAGDDDDVAGTPLPPPPPPPPPPLSPLSRPSFAITATPRRRKISLPKPRQAARPHFSWPLFFDRQRRRLPYSKNPILAV